MDELNIQLKRLPEGCDYAVQTYEDTAFGSKWIFQKIADRHSFDLRRQVVSLDMALKALRKLSDYPARVVKISRYVPWGTEELLVHKVISCNAKALHYESP